MYHEQVWSFGLVYMSCVYLHGLWVCQIPLLAFNFGSMLFTPLFSWYFSFLLGQNFNRVTSKFCGTVVGIFFLFLFGNPEMFWVFSVRWWWKIDGECCSFLRWYCQLRLSCCFFTCEFFLEFFFDVGLFGEKICSVVWMVFVSGFSEFCFPRKVQENLFWGQDLASVSFWFLGFICRSNLFMNIILLLLLLLLLPPFFFSLWTLVSDGWIQFSFSWETNIIKHVFSVLMFIPFSGPKTWFIFLYAKQRNKYLFFLLILPAFSELYSAFILLCTSLHCQKFSPIHNLKKNSGYRF